MSDSTHDSQQERSPGVYARVSFVELTKDLIWPHLLRVVGYSVGPGRIIVGTLVALWVFGGAALIEATQKSVQSLFADDGAEPSGSAFAALGAVWPTGGPAAVGDRFDGMLAGLGASAAWQWAFVALWALPVLSLGAVVIARQVAVDFCADRSLPTLRCVRFARERWGSVLVYTLAPAGFIAAIALLLWLAGLVFFTTAFTGVLGAVLFGVAILAAVPIVLVGALYVASFFMMPAAIAIENTDGMDALQRSFSYVTNRLVRFAGYTLVIGALLFASYSVAQTAVRAVYGTALSTTGADDMANNAFDRAFEQHQERAAELRQELSSARTDNQREEVAGRLEAHGARPATPVRVRLLGWWEQALWLVFIGWVFSFVSGAGTLLYLVMRHVTDGDDVRAVWLPVEEDDGPAHAAQPGISAEDRSEEASGDAAEGAKSDYAERGRSPGESPGDSQPDKSS